MKKRRINYTLLFAVLVLLIIIGIILKNWDGFIDGFNSV